MDWIVEPERRVPVVAATDVLVCGGGVAGVAAAVCAARNGARTMLIEHYGFFGGMATGGLVITTPPLNNGINLEVVKRLRDRGLFRKCLAPGEDPAQSSLTAFDPEVLKYDLQQMLLEANVRILLHTGAVQVISRGATVDAVIVENKGGRQAIRARIVVDATGDGDVAFFAGAQFDIAEDPLPITLMFNMVDVDIERVLQHIGHWGNLRKHLRQALDKGELQYDLELEPSKWAPGLYGANLVYDDEINVWTGSLYGKSAIDPDDLTEAELVSRDHAMRLVQFLRGNIRGFEHSRIEYTATQVGIRETRRIRGGVMPSLHDAQTVDFSDTVAKPYATTSLRVPYRALVPESIDNVLVAGRCISAQQDAMVQLRLIPPCFATGQAAGTAAALCVRNSVSPRMLDVALLRNTLSRQGMNLSLHEDTTGTVSAT